LYAACTEGFAVVSMVLVVARDAEGIKAFVVVAEVIRTPGDSFVVEADLVFVLAGVDATVTEVEELLVAIEAVFGVVEFVEFAFLSR